MSLFTINVSGLLSSYPGYATDTTFSGDIEDDYYEDLCFVDTLTFSLRLIHVDDGIEAFFRDISTEVEYGGELFTIDIPEAVRSFKEIRGPRDPDDIQYIDMKRKEIDIGSMIREEILLEVLRP